MDPEKKQFAWWYYFWLLVALAALSPLFLENTEDWLRWVYGIPALVGLWGYLRRRPFGHRYVWVGYFGLLVIDILYGWAFGPSVDIPSDFRLAFGLVSVLVTALVVPLFIALWRYAFRSPDIWRHPAGAA